MSLNKVAIKGTRQGLLVTLEDDWNSGVRALASSLNANPAFFRGGRMALDVGWQELKHSQIRDMRTLLARHEVELWAVLSFNQVTKSSARELGLVTELALPTSDVTKSEVEEDQGLLSDGLVVRRTLRSGQSLRHPGHIAIIGDVNPGSEVVAGGDIVVWGHVRGLVHAGAFGDEEAVVCALDLVPTQLRIAGYIARSPEERKRDPVPEMALVRKGQIVAIPWYGGDSRRVG